MKVLFDYQSIMGQRYGGVSRYFFELFQRLQKKDDVTLKLYCLFNNNAYFENGRNHKLYSKIRGKGIINRLYMRWHLVFDRYDVFHPTNYNPYFLKYNKGKLVLTVYDMIHELMSDYFSDAATVIENKKLLIHKADMIIAISESTKRDILRLYPDIDEKKIAVIYIGSNFKVSDMKGVDNRFPSRYVLFVGTRRIYKNYDSFFESMIPILESDRDIHLVCIGGGKFTDQELAKQKTYEDRIHQMNVDDQTLCYAYSHALCFVFPSLYEGFGLPTLEAFACDCPVVLSNTSSMPEVGGDAAEYFNPNDMDDMTQKIQTVINNEDLRAKMIEKGREQVKKFDWDEITEQTIACYKQVLNENAI